MPKIGVSTSREAVSQVTLGVLVSGNSFSGLGISVPVGRGFLPEEDYTPGRNPVAVISDSMWERQFNSDLSGIGGKLRLNGSEFTIVGVTERSFTGPEAYLLPEVYVPMNSFPQVLPDSKTDFLTERDRRTVAVFGRLKPGTNIQTAQAELAILAKALEVQYPATNRDRSITVLKYQQARFEQNSTDAVLALTLMESPAWCCRLHAPTW